MSSKKGFYAYAAAPSEIGETIESALRVSRPNANLEIKSWKELDIFGHFISTEVISSIDKADFLLADISVLNFNVTYEIGYAIGSHKQVFLTKNLSIKDGPILIKDVGIFDTLGYFSYQNSSDISGLIRGIDELAPLPLKNKINTKSPVYLLEGLHKTDWMTRVVSRIKKSKYLFRSFDPNEQARLSAHDAIDQVAQSHGVVIPLLSRTAVGSDVHNMRAAFIAGLAKGMGKATCLIQNGDGDPVPMDYRDFIRSSRHPGDVDEIIADFAGDVASAFQEERGVEHDSSQSFLQSLDLGASSAENEMRTLESYYLKTDQFLKSLRGEVNIVVGRKGSGKSAIFLQIRDRERNKSGNIVLDLKPDGYKLIKFKELILSFLEEGTFQHTIMAFWEYVLLLEICYKILEKDRERHLADQKLYQPYRELADAYHADGYITEGDFSERMSSLMEKISTEYRSRHGDETGVRLDVKNITEILYCHDVRRLTDQVASYMKHKDSCWLLFDNIDKGWPTSGLKHEDLIIIRALIDATKKIERHFNKASVTVNSIIFLRNDVYELLVKETSDRGKEAKVLLDWTDADLLREVLRLRIISNGLNKAELFDAAWVKICVSHYRGEESSQYLIDRSLMRPRFLLNLVGQCKSFAINLGHERIEVSDIEKGLAAYSADLVSDIGYEINDIAGDVPDVLYAFIGSNGSLRKSEIALILKDYGVREDKLDGLIEVLLWYGFLGLIVSGESSYIYNYNYSMNIILGIIKKNPEIEFIINPGFWPALMISG